MNVFHLQFYDFWVGMEEAGTYQLEVFVDHHNTLTECHTRKRANPEDLPGGVVGKWWGDWHIDVMYETGYCSNSANTGWVETDMGLASKTITICVNGKSVPVVGKTHYPFYFLATGPRRHALRLFDGDTPCGIIYYTVRCQHKGLAGVPLSVTLQKFTITHTHNLSDQHITGEFRWRNNIIETDPSHLDSLPAELANGRQSFSTKGVSLEEFFNEMFSVKIRQGSDVIWGESSLSQFVKTLRVFAGHRITQTIGEKQSRLSFSLELSAGGKTVTSYIQLAVNDAPKYAQMTSGVLTHHDLKDPRSFIIHCSAFCQADPVWEATGTGNPLEQWHHAGNPTPLVWGYPIPSLDDNTPIEVSRDDGVKLAYQDAFGKWFLRPHGVHRLPQDWSAHEAVNPHDSTTTYYFKDHNPLASHEATWVPPSPLPLTWTARASARPEHMTPHGPLIYYYPEGKPSEGQWEVPRDWKGRYAVTCPPNVTSVVIPSGEHKGTVFYQLHGSGKPTVASWRPPKNHLTTIMLSADQTATPTPQHTPQSDLYLPFPLPPPQTVPPPENPPYAAPDDEV